LCQEIHATIVLKERVILLSDLKAKRQLDSLKTKGITPVTIVVYVKEAFEWEIGQRPKGRETNWTANDVNKFGHLTITGLRVYGGTTASR
jgi:hypothetical protein